MKHTLEIQGRPYGSSSLLGERYGASASALWRSYKRGLLSPPIKLGRRNYYMKDEVESRLAQGE